MALEFSVSYRSQLDRFKSLTSKTEFEDSVLKFVQFTQRVNSLNKEGTLKVVRFLKENDSIFNNELYNLETAVLVAELKLLIDDYAYSVNFNLIEEN